MQVKRTEIHYIEIVFDFQKEKQFLPRPTLNVSLIKALGKKVLKALKFKYL